jgi:hypothetical protein
MIMLVAVTLITNDIILLVPATVKKNDNYASPFHSKHKLWTQNSISPASKKVKLLAVRRGV